MIAPRPPLPIRYLMLGDMLEEGAGIGGDRGPADLAGPGALVEPLNLLGSSSAAACARRRTLRPWTMEL